VGVNAVFVICGVLLLRPLINKLHAQADQMLPQIYNRFFLQFCKQICLKYWFSLTIPEMCIKMSTNIPMIGQRIREKQHGILNKL